LLEGLEFHGGLVDMEARWVVVVGVLLLADLGKCILEVFDVV
jgi:hypothetical protein